jgi:hypothetical protein
LLIIRGGCLLKGLVLSFCYIYEVVLFVLKSLFCYLVVFLFTGDGENCDFVWVSAQDYSFLSKNKPSNPSALLSAKRRQATQLRQIFNLIPILSLTFAPFHIHPRMARKDILSGNVTLN